MKYFLTIFLLLFALQIAIEAFRSGCLPLLLVAGVAASLAKFAYDEMD